MPAWGIYIHVPFCPYHCAYCDFDAGVFPARLRQPYVEAVIGEIAYTRAHLYPNGLTADTIYFGGGTPALLTTEQLHQMMEAVHQHFTIADDAEVTLEANPESIGEEKAEKLKEIGINRVSIGAQSFVERHLRQLGRGHTAQDVWTCFRILREVGLTNLNLDLIAGLPNQSLSEWQYTVDQALALRPAHISAYLLEVHEGTPLARLLQRGRWPQPDEELSVQMYELLLDRARAEGYEHYELSNYALPGCRSRHNLKYWSDAPYLGFGCSAASYDWIERRVNVKTPSAYIDQVARQGHAISMRTPVTQEIRRQEALFLGLRQTSGIDLHQFQTRYGIDVWAEYQAALTPLIEAGLLTRENGWLKLTRRGLTLSNEVFTAFV